MLTQDSEQLDSLIRIINNQNPKPPLQSKKQLPPLQHKIKISMNLNTTKISKPKVLTFKPWSGSVSIIDQYASQFIKEEIENEEEQDDEEKEEYIVQNKDSKLIGSATTGNEIGYFYKFQTGKVKLIKCLLDENGFKDSHNNNKNWSILWSSTPFKMQTYRALLPYQKANHFPNSFHLTRKDLMNKTISKMQVKYGITHFNFLPKTYILPLELQQLIAQNTKHPQITYIVKPHNRSQGKGITVTNSIQTITNKLQKYSSLIVSHYISNPLLINRLKFDLRIYVAIMGINPLRIYVYEEGLARFATQEYDASGYDSENKRYQHLTNYSVNKKNADFVASNNQNQDYFGSKWSLSAMKDFLAFNIGRSETSQLFDRIDQVIVKTILSAQNLLFTSFQSNVPYINGCFQVLGFDIMIDSNLKPWLIEVNHSPSMNTDSTLDLKIKGNMIADLFTMAGMTPLNERYMDGGHSKFESKYYFIGGERKGSGESGVDKFILKEVQNQYERRGDWRRVFPSLKTMKFKNYFQTDRYFNKILREKGQLQGGTSVSLQPNILRGNYRSSTVQKGSQQSKRPSLRFVKKEKGDFHQRFKTRASNNNIQY